MRSFRRDNYHRRNMHSDVANLYRLKYISFNKLYKRE